MGLIKKQAGFDLKSKIETWIKESIMSQTFMYGALIVDEKTMMIKCTDVKDISTVLCLIISDILIEGKLPPPYICFYTPFEITTKHFDLGCALKSTRIKATDILNKIVPTFPNLDLIYARYYGNLQSFVRVNDKFVMADSTYSYCKD